MSHPSLAPEKIWFFGIGAILPTNERTAMTDIVERLRSVSPSRRLNMHGEAADEIERLRAALEPFARNVYAVSLREALGHIGRTHLEDARRALEEKK